MAEGTNNFNLNESMKFLLESFKIERYIYIGLSLLSFIMLVVLIWYFFQKQEYLRLLIMLGPTGMMTVSGTKFLKMWTDCIELTKAYISQPNKPSA